VNDHVVRDYIDAVMRLHDGVQENVEEETLAEIASSLGLEPSDMARVKREAERALERGLNYLDRKMWDEAAEDLATAAALTPDRVEALGAYAQALDGRWFRDREESDGLQAQELSRRCLERDASHQASYAILKRHGDIQRRRLVMYRIGALSLLVSVVFLSTWLVRSQQGVSEVPAAGDKAAVDVDASVVNSTSKETDAGQKPRARQTDIPVTMVAGRIDGLETEVRHLRWTEDRGGTIEDPSSEPKVHLVGVIENLGSRSVSRIDMRISLSDRYGREIKRRKFVALGTHEASLRPGDRQAFSQRITVEDVAFLRATLEVELVQHQELVQGSAAKEITPTWAIVDRNEVRIWIGEREEVRTAAASGDEVYHKAVWEFQNLGLEPIAQLGVDVEYLDSEGVLLERERHWFVYDGGPKLFPGEKRLIRVVGKVSNRQDGYLLRIVSVL
jgi:hypothetical protein